MSANIISSFLVSLGFKVDQGSQKKFITGITEAAKRVTLLGASVKAASALIFRNVLKTADSLDQLSDMSIRVGAPVKEIERLGYVASQMDSSVEAARSSMERLSVISGEAALGVGRGAMYFKQLGINAKNADGTLKPVTQLIGEISKRLKGMEKGEQFAFLQRLGIDRTMFRTLTEDVSGLSDEFERMYSVAGIDAEKSAQAASDFMDEWGKLKEMSRQLYRAVNVGFMMKFKDDIMRLRKMLMENGENIKRVVSGIMTLITRLASAIGNAVMRIVGWIMKGVDWFNNLDDGTQNLIWTIGALLLAWKALNLSFLATPLGALIAGLAALFLVVDDLLTYIEGGESYFNWGKWEPQIKAVADAIEGIKATVLDVFEKIKPIVEKGINAVIANIQDVVDTIINLFGPISDMFTAIFEGDAVGAIEAFVNISKELFDLFIRVTERVFDVFLDIIEAIFGSEARQIVEDFGNAAKEFIQAFVDKALWLIDYFSEEFAAIFNALGVIVEAAFDIIVGTVEAFIGIVTGIFKGLTAILTGDWEGLSEAIKGIIDTLINWFRNVPARVAEAISGVFGALLGPFQKAFDKIKGLWNNFMGIFRKDKSEVDKTNNDPNGVYDQAPPPPDSKGKGAGKFAAGGWNGGNGDGWAGDIYNANAKLNAMQGPQLAPTPAQQAALTQNTNVNDSHDTTVNAKVTVYEAKDAAATGEAVSGGLSKVTRDTGNVGKPFAPAGNGG